MYVSAGENGRGHYFVPELYVEKMVFTSYTDALNARALLKKHFGKMEIKPILGGFGLYTRSDSSSIHMSRYHHRRRGSHGGRTNSPIGVRFGTHRHGSR
jgi:hypothetical protein